jgi:uncharacterized membrane protein
MQNLHKIKNKYINKFWMSQRGKKFSILLFFFVGIAFVITGAFYLYSIPSVHESIVLATTVQPERFTELYFENHLNLSKNVEAGKQNTFKFTTHNLEYKQMTYSYEVYIDIDGYNKISIDKNQFTINNDQYKTIEEAYQIFVPIKRAKVLVNLINKNQQIDFWIEENKETTIISTPTIESFYSPISLIVGKQYGGWYWQPELSKAQIWLGKDEIGQDIWSDKLL